MAPIKTIFVTGITGNQGGAVAISLLKNGFRVKGLTRKPDSTKAKDLATQGIQIIQGDLNEPNSYRTYLKDVDGIFSVQSFEDGIDKEIKQGLSLADLAKEYGIAQFVYASVNYTDFKTGIPHFESKLIIENHIKQLGIPYTILRPAALFENFLIPQVKSRIMKGKLSSPAKKNVNQQFISAIDIGNMSAEVFMNTNKYMGETISMSSVQMDMEQAANIFSKVMGRKIEYQNLPMLITRLFMGSDLYKMFKWINGGHAVITKEIENYRREHPEHISLEDWIKLYFK